MLDGFVKAAAGAPEVRVADVKFNVSQIIETMRSAYDAGVRLLTLPELCVTGYTCSDLFLQTALLDAAEDGLSRIIDASRDMPGMLAAVGVPIRRAGKLYNCAAMICGGVLLGAVPKTHLPNYSEFCELRHFSPAPDDTLTVRTAGRDVPFGTKLLFCCREMTDLVVSAEICEDLWAPLPPSVKHAAAGASVIMNISASSEFAEKDSYRKNLVVGQSARLMCAYMYAGAGEGESTTDIVFSGHSMIAENGKLLAETKPFEKGLAVTEIDVSKVVFERIRNTVFPAADDTGYTRIEFSSPISETVLTRKAERYPFIPEDEDERRRRCELILTIQATGLKRRLMHTRVKKAIIGISGGLDSTLALLVAVRAMDMLSRPRTDVIGVTMPCFGTTTRTKGNAELLTELVGAELRQIDISESVACHLKDIGHDINVCDVTFENAQARERTQVLMDIANDTGGLVIGTGDLSELALGWATYNGDHMSMYGVNASVPKTLIRSIVSYEADCAKNKELADVLRDILSTPVSPELLPTKDGDITQKTEELIGPYELHDFFLYNAIQCGFRPRKVLRVAETVFNDYDHATLVYWLKNFYRRFFAQQFKRSCLPDGPKVGSLSLSPRGDWHMPSDACADVWLAEAEAL